MEQKVQVIAAKQKEQTTIYALFLTFSVSQGGTDWEQLNSHGYYRLYDIASVLKLSLVQQAAVFYGWALV